MMDGAMIYNKTAQPVLAINQQYRLLQSAINIYMEFTGGD